MKERPLITLCIPTYGVVGWVELCIQSIYDQEVNEDLFEVVITDNGKDKDLEELIKSYNYSNLYYYKTKELGFVNQIAAFKLSNGIYIKMINHRSRLLAGALQDMINLVRQNIEKKPIFYFSDGVLDLPDFTYCKDTDTLIRNIHYYISWSAGVGLWNTDKESLDEIHYSQMYPHISVLIDIRKDAEYLICNKRYQRMQNDEGKGGYDPIYTFAVTLLDELKGLCNNNRISMTTFKIVKKRLITMLTSTYYCEVVCKSTTKHTFVIKDVRKSMLHNYSYCDYLKLVITAYYRQFKVVIKQFLRKHNSQYEI